MKSSDIIPNLEVATSAVLVMKPTQAQLMRGEFPETLCIEQGVVLSFRFAKRKVRRAPRVLRMAVVSQSNVKFGKKRVLIVGATNFSDTIVTILNGHV